VDKARKLQGKIEYVDNKISDMSASDLYAIEFHFKQSGNRHIKASDHDGVVLSDIIPVTINALKNHRDQLQKELDEL
jgi:hypothetical protein